tara:strand:+ start:412 stop:1275 length:864 start_codon:yes stop_codon:yes gene_type:complete
MSVRSGLSTGRPPLIEDGLQDDAFTIQNLFADMFEVHGDTAVDAGLHLSQPPVGLGRVPHQHAGFEKGVGVSHERGLRMRDSVDQDMFDTAEGPDLLALLGSRLCHDLVNPIGAIGNGLELLEMTDGDGIEEMALIRASLTAAMARIRFFRFAFGAGADNAQVPAREIREALEEMYGTTRTRILWRDEETRPRSEIRLACLALNCIEVATPWGAQIEVTRNNAAWVLHVDAKRLKIDETLWQCLGRGDLPGDLKGSEVQFGILARASRRLRRPVSVSADDSHLSLIV